MWNTLALYGSKASAPPVPMDGGDLTIWLRARLAAVQNLTFHRFRVGCAALLLLCTGAVQDSPCERQPDCESACASLIDI